MKLTKKQKIFFEALKDNYGCEPLPSFDKICADLGFRSKNSIWQYFKKLLKLGAIKESNNRFFIPNETGSDIPRIPYYEGGVRAGFPSPAEDYLEDERVSFDEMLITKPASTFSVRVIGDSMIEASISENDIAIVERGKTPKNGDIVVAIVDCEYTIKYYYKKGSRIELEPANPKYKKIIPREELKILGVVTGIVRKY